MFNRLLSMIPDSVRRMFGFLPEQSNTPAASSSQGPAGQMRSGNPGTKVPRHLRKARTRMRNRMARASRRRNRRK